MNKNETLLAAQKGIIDYLNAIGIDALVEAEMVGMRTIIRVKMVDVGFEVSNKIAKICKRYQKGTFNGLGDGYVDNVDFNDYPKVSFVLCGKHNERKNACKNLG